MFQSRALICATWHFGAINQILKRFYVSPAYLKSFLPCYTAARRCPDSVITLSIINEITEITEKTELKISIDFTGHKSPII